MLKISICDKLMLEILKLLRLLKSDYLKRTRIMRRAVVIFGNNFRNFKLKIQMSWLGFFVKIDEYWLTIFAWECPQPEWLEHPVKWLIRSSFIGISWNPTLGGIFFLKLGNSLQLQLIDNFLNLFYSSILAGLAFNSAGYLISPVFTLLSIWPNPVTASLSHQARTRGTRNPPSVTTGFSWIHYIVIWEKIIFYNSRYKLFIICGIYFVSKLVWCTVLWSLKKPSNPNTIFLKRVDIIKIGWC